MEDYLPPPQKYSLYHGCLVPIVMVTVLALMAGAFVYALCLDVAALRLLWRLVIRGL